MDYVMAPGVAATLGLLFAFVLNTFSKIPPLIPHRGLFSHPPGGGVGSR